MVALAGPAHNLHIMILLQNIFGGTRPALFAAVLRSDFFGDSPLRHAAPVIPDRRSGTYPDTEAGIERDAE